MGLYPLGQYLRTLPQRKGSQWLHSPFFFEVYQKAVHGSRPNDPRIAKLEGIRKDLLADQSVLHIEDFGAGSRKLPQRTRTIRQIARTSLKPRPQAEQLHRLAGLLESEVIIELGTCLGITTAYLALSHPRAKVYSLEGSPQLAERAQATFDALGLTNIELIVGRFDDTLPVLLNRLPQVDFAFLDGNHQKAPTLAYLEQLLPKAHENTALIFDDIYWSADMRSAWEAVQAHSEILQSLDLFHMGWAFTRSTQAEEHLMLRG